MRCPRCNTALTHIADLPSARGFEFDLFACRECRQHVMGCFCVASSISGTEEVTPEDAAAMMKSDPRQLAELMKEWQARVIGV